MWLEVWALVKSRDRQMTGGRLTRGDEMCGAAARLQG